MALNVNTPRLEPSSLVSGKILGIETSCDETAAAVLNHEGKLLSSVLASQHEVHSPFGGVVPELASRRHLENIEGIVCEAMKRAHMGWHDLGAVAVTRGPGLAGALVVGVSFGKALAFALNIPWVAVHHLEGHLASIWLDQPDFPPPFVALVVSGGHTHLYFVPHEETYQLIGRTLDDAAGEAFDKGAKMLGLSYPGGPALERLARAGNPDAIHFPRPHLNRGGLNFSFSGLKTALLYHLRDLERKGQSCPKPDLAASYQEAIVEVLVEKSFRAVRQYKVQGLAVVGGVSANSRLRAFLSTRARDLGVRLALPRMEFCTDNAAMIAVAGWRAYRLGQYGSWDMDVAPNLSASQLGALASVG